ncbi:GPP34 family phosphoprotein [Streptomyces sp. HYC2]|uniref:GOLPH3/VPS74 family protein n=1 Tax=Streptomyces sp. HYC2 TaxID=2955207 RepID=UPI00247FB080|nr:GPP34 family phosphoprotein [Streptomyces sp. HYC2]
MPDGSLSLPARLYLLAWDTERLKITGTAQLHLLVRAGALTELAQRGLLVDDDGVAVPAGLDADTGDPVLDGLLELVRESRPRRWKAWVTLHARTTLDAVREQLTAEGFLRAERRRVLGVLPSVDYALERVAVVDALREEARRALEGPLPAAEVSEGDAAVVALAAAAELRTLVPAKDRRRHRQRIEELTERGGAAAPALRRVMREVSASVVMATTAASAAAASG